MEVQAGNTTHQPETRGSMDDTLPLRSVGLAQASFKHQAGLVRWRSMGLSENWLRSHWKVEGSTKKHGRQGFFSSAFPFRGRISFGSAYGNHPLLAIL